MTIIMSGLFALSILLTILAVGCGTWSFMLGRRSSATGKLRRQLIEFAFQDVTNRKQRVAWYEGLPSYSIMCPLGLFGPFFNKPLLQMIDGKYAEEFKKWRAE